MLTARLLRSILLASIAWAGQAADTHVFEDQASHSNSSHPVCLVGPNADRLQGARLLCANGGFLVPCGIMPSNVLQSQAGQARTMAAALECTEVQYVAVERRSASTIISAFGP